MGIINEKNLSIRRSLSILRHLQREPCAFDALFEYVRVDVDPNAYSAGDKPTGRKQFENDIRRLRELGVEIDHYDGQYHLLGYSDFSPVSLGEESLNTIAFLTEAFGPGAPNHQFVRSLLDTIMDWLPENERDSIPMRQHRLRMDLRRKDDDKIEGNVQAAISRALGRQMLRFDYLSPSQEDGVPRRHTVQPWRLYFDTERRHLYLDAYWTEIDGPHGQWSRGGWQRYRLGRILPARIEVLPDRLPPTPPKRPRHRLEYLLAPTISRLGEVTRHFEEMKVHEPNDHGWVRITATTDDLFGAVRALLRYGPNCEVIGGSEARMMTISTIERMANLYMTAPS